MSKAHTTISPSQVICGVRGVGGGAPRRDVGATRLEAERQAVMKRKMTGRTRTLIMDAEQTQGKEKRRGEEEVCWGGGRGCNRRVSASAA